MAKGLSGTKLPTGSTRRAEGEFLPCKRRPRIGPRSLLPRVCDEGDFLHRCANEQKIISKQVEFQTQISRVKLNSERIINIRDYSSEFDRCFS